MTQCDPRQTLIDVIFTEALELPLSERDQFLHRRCAGDEGLRAAVAALLHSAAQPENGFAGAFDALRNDLFRSIASDGIDEENLAGQKFNNWLLVEPVARGGLATVYLARRDDGEFEQTVAFKVLRRGLDTDDLIARFRAERQILSSLDHPAIVQILDGGALPDGRPYLVLDYVDGSSITDYCSTLKLSFRERVILIAEVLAALQHAHRHLVIHRDIKPSNILVSREGNVALLDFGIAKLLDDNLAGGSSPRTRTGISLLTPGYGSPEQKAGQPVSTASDIFQAGLVLFELITGERPPGADCPPPSSMLKSTAARAEVRGDLDAIVAKAMHPEPAARYGSASEMRADLMRYLDGQPITARPDTLIYRLSKLVRRRPWLLPAGLVAALVVVGYVVTLTFYTGQLRQEQARATAVQAFMVDLLSSPDPFLPADPERGQQITVVEAIDLGRDRIRQELDGQPEIRASLLVSISTIYQSLGQIDRARRLREEALTLQLAIHGKHSAPVVESTRFLAQQYASLGETQLAEAFFQRQLALAQELFDPNSPDMGVAEAAMGTHLDRQGKLEDAALMLQSGIAKMRPRSVEFARPLLNAIAMLVGRLIWEPPEGYLEMLLDARGLADQVYGPDSVQGAMVRTQLATTLSALGDSDGAIENFRKALETYEARLGRGHEETLSTLNNFSLHYQRNGAAETSELLLREILERQLEQHGEQNREVANSYQNLASAVSRQGRFDDAIPLHRKAYEIYRQVLEQDHYYIAFPLLSIAYGELQQNRIDEAETAASEAVSRLRKSSLVGSSVEGIGLCLLARAHEALGRPADASLAEAHRLMREGPVYEPYLSFCALKSD